jgi:hypothetical protein
METAFNAIGLEVANETAFDNLAESVEKRGEVSRLTRTGGVLHGRCWRIGEGLEVWTVLYQTETGEVFYADCRPGFRARFRQRITPWLMTEFAEAGEALIHGFIQETETEVLFELQNITEVSAKNFQNNTLLVGLCGLAFRAETVSGKTESFWKNEKSREGNENVWSLCGEIIGFSSLKNPISGSDLYWLHLNLGDFDLEVLVNQKNLDGEDLQIGAFIRADVWLQGHIISESTFFSRYEGVDYTHRTVDFWQKFKRLN